jgi:hypothetical protein
MSSLPEVEVKYHPIKMESVLVKQTPFNLRGTTNDYAIQSDDVKICVVMVGLPARGKSLIAGKGRSPSSHLPWFLAAED